MAFNGSGTVSSGSGSTGNTAASGNGGNQDGPLNKRLCTGKENNEAGLNNNRVSSSKQIAVAFYLHYTIHLYNIHVLTSVCVCVCVLAELITFVILSQFERGRRRHKNKAFMYYIANAYRI